ncbi:AhpC/TSA family protein [Parabacteroides sp. OttesenSCG-928-J18]|nr:AhpC/TSA family protein [Parabacteroides sp. OttesenSCG-928-J18]
MIKKQRNKLVVFIFFFIGISTHHFGQQSTFNLHGKIDSKHNGYPIMLFTFYNNDSIRSVDTTVVQSGEFHFYGNEYVDDISLVTIGNYPDPVTFLELYLDKGNISVNLIDSFYAKGSYLNDALSMYRDSSSFYSKAINDMVDKNKKEDGKYQKEINDFWQALFDFRYNFLKKNKSNIIGRRIFIEELLLYEDSYFTDSVNTNFDDLYNNVFRDIKDTPEVESLMNHRRKKTERNKLVGNKYVDFEIISPEGESLRISDYVGKSDYLFIDFWASWCGPCLAEMPHLKEVYNKYSNEGLTVIGVSVHDNESSWKNALRKTDTPWLQFIASDDVSKEIYETYKITGIPYNILIDKNGVIIAVGSHGIFLDFIMESLITLQESYK